MIKKIVVFSIISAVFLIFIVNSIYKKKSEELVSIEKENYNTNLLENIKYVAKDDDGNEYIINAAEGEIDLNNSDIIFLKNVKSQIKLKNSDQINITSNFGKYNASNYDTIFSKNVVITYLDNKITGEYLDLSMLENRIIVSKNIIFTTFSILLLLVSLNFWSITNNEINQLIKLILLFTATSYLIKLIFKYIL